VIPILDIEDMQQALDALINGDHQTAARRFTQDVVLTGVGGCLSGRAAGLPAILGRFADMSRLTHRTYGTEVEAVYTGGATQLIALTRHWAMIHGKQVYGTQALLITVEGRRIDAIGVFSRPGPPTGIWD
jgi:hypothetical protein